MLVGNSVSPGIEVLQVVSPFSVSRLQRQNFIPESQSKSPKIRPDIARVGVATVEFPSVQELFA